eukprot:TRINITY_DN2944_c0_g1_i1.p1 TRINITY_DN2944_c0_g1~~TRINITY_DN2944_c0_g1_i1.p1  ORF type:complete len:365 (-),score=80.99 TRINITY_DN2944_c0_g1_i1:607-1626(-)
MYNQEPIDFVDTSMCDISLEDTRWLTPYEMINTAIERELSLPQYNDVEHEDYQNAINSENLYDRALEVVPRYDLLEKRKEESGLHSYTHFMISALKPGLKIINYLSLEERKKALEGIKGELIDPEELIITVSFYHPKKSKKMQGFRVLGSQLLTQLRDRLYCLSDLVLNGPKVHSGFFFIEDVFYNDGRDPENLDYSDQIIKWAGNSRKSFYRERKYSKKPMEETRFVDLELCVGKDYLYCHQGDCEHIMVFEEIRKINQDDILLKNEYPFHLFQCKIQRRKCTMCNVYPASKVTIGNIYSPQDVCYYCDHCYRLFHYDEENKLIFDQDSFQVFPYFHE